MTVDIESTNSILINIVLLLILILLSCGDKASNSRNANILRCGDGAREDIEYIQVWGGYNQPIARHFLFGAWLIDGSRKSFISFTQHGCFRLPDSGHILLRTMDRLRYLYTDVETLQGLDRVFLADNDGTKGETDQVEILGYREVNGQQFRIVKPGYQLHFYNIEQTRYDIEYCVKPVDVSHSLENMVGCKNLRYYLKDFPFVFTEGSWLVEYRHSPKQMKLDSLFISVEK